MCQARDTGGLFLPKSSQDYTDNGFWRLFFQKVADVPCAGFLPCQLWVTLSKDVLIQISHTIRHQIRRWRFHEGHRKRHSCPGWPSQSLPHIAVPGDPFNHCPLTARNTKSVFAIFLKILWLLPKRSIKSVVINNGKFPFWESWIVDVDSYEILQQNCNH